MCVQKGGFVISRFFFIYCILLKLGQRKSFVILRTSLYRGSLYRSSTVAGKCEAGNSLNLAVMTVVSQHSQLTVHCYPLTSQILQCCLLSNFGRKKLHCQMSCDLEVTNGSTCSWGEISSYITNHFVMQVQENGMTDTVCTLFELRAGDDTVNEGQLIELSLLFIIINLRLFLK